MKVVGVWRLLKVETPCYVVSEEKIEKNLKILKSIEKETGVKILMAIKVFLCFLFSLINKYLSGMEASP